MAWPESLGVNAKNRAAAGAAEQARGAVEHAVGALEQFALGRAAVGRAAEEIPEDDVARAVLVGV